MTPFVPQRPGRGAHRLASLVGATAMAMVLAACVQTGTQTPIQYAAPGQSYATSYGPAWAPPAGATVVDYATYAGGYVGAAPALSSTYLGQTSLGQTAGLYSPTTNYLSDVTYGATTYAAPITSYAPPATSYVSAAPAPIYNPAPLTSYQYGSTTASVGGVTLYDGRLPSAPSYAQPTSYVSGYAGAPNSGYATTAQTYAAPAPAPIYDPAPSYNYAATGYAQPGAVTFYDGRLPSAPSYAAQTSYAAPAPIYDPAPNYGYAATAQTYGSVGSLSAPSATSYAQPTIAYANPPIHDPWPTQSQTINATPWQNAYAPAPVTTSQAYWPQGQVTSSVYGPGLGVALNQYATSYPSGDVLFRLNDLGFGGSGYAQSLQQAPSQITYGGTPYELTRAVVGPVQSTQLGAPTTGLGIGSYQQSWNLGAAPAPSPAPLYDGGGYQSQHQPQYQPQYQPQTSYTPTYVPPPSGSYPRPYSVSGIGLYPPSASPAGVASARVLGVEYAPQPVYEPNYGGGLSSVFAPGTPIYGGDVPQQRYVNEIIRLPQHGGPATNAASLRAGEMIPASLGGSAYQVMGGDTLYGIARLHGVSAQALAAANGLTLDAVIYPGQPLSIPRGGIGPLVPVYQTVASLSASVPARLGRIETGSVESLRAEIRPATLRAPGPRAASPEFIWPLKGPTASKRDAYGVTSLAVRGQPGAPVRAAAAGEIVHVENGPQGVMVVIDHGGGWTSINVGLAETPARLGDRVEAGQHLGVLAPRAETALIFELRRNNLPVDPTDRLRG